MATGPEHYTEAQRLIGLSWTNSLSPAGLTAVIARAQAHATLAQAAATAMAGRTSNATGVFGMDEADFEAWDRVAGVQEDEHDDEDNAGDEDGEWRSHDVSDVMQTAEIHNAPMPGDEVFNEDGAL